MVCYNLRLPDGRAVGLLIELKFCKLSSKVFALRRNFRDSTVDDVDVSTNA